MNPLYLSILFHAVGAFSAAMCYTPQKKVKGWSWQSYWLIQAAFCWLILPVVGAFLTVPDFMAVVREAPASAMRNSFLLGALYGIGGTAFGVAIRYVGFSVTYAMAIGISTVVGTGYAILKGEGAEAGLARASGHFQAFAAKAGSGWILAGLGIGLAGICACGVAGKWKEADHAQAHADAGAAVPTSRKVLIGMLLCVLAGVLSAVYGMALTEGAPIAEIAAKQAAGKTLMGIDAATFSSNAIFVFSNSGAFLTTALYCLFLHRKHKTLGEAVNGCADGGKDNLTMNWAMAILTGCLWYGQFFFYGFGHFFIEQVRGFGQTCWAIHMILLILMGTLVGVVLKEWQGGRARTYGALVLTLVLLCLGMVALSRGNYLGQQAAEKAAAMPQNAADSQVESETAR